MKWILSRYEHKIAYLKDYTDDWIMYDRSRIPLNDTKVIITANRGSDIYDKFSFIIDNYDNLPDVAVYTKANIFDFIKPREFEKIKDNTTFTPILSQDHHTYSDSKGIVCFYKDNIYWERNDLWYIGSHPCKNNPYELMDLLGIKDMKYVPFAPGSGYILTRENIQQKSLDFYIKLRSYLEWDRYPGESMIIERGLYTIWKPKI